LQQAIRALEDEITEQEGGLAGKNPPKAMVLPAAASLGRKVFIAHGHAGEPREAVARFLERIGLEPIILHEQAKQRKTVIEKFEAHDAGDGWRQALANELEAAGYKINWKGDEDMNQLVPTAHDLPTPIATAGAQTQERVIEFFTARIRNGNTRRSYALTVREFLAWCEVHGVRSITAVQSVHVASYIEELARARSAPTAKQRLAAIRHLFDWFVVGQVMPVNPASSVRGPSHVVKRGKTPVLSPEQARRVLDAIDVTSHAGMRDRALIGLMVFAFARIGAALAMKVGDVFTQDRRLWVRLREKGGKRHEMPCHHNLDAYLHAYIDGAGIAADPKGPLFRTIGRVTGQLTRTPLPQANAYAMIRRRAHAVAIKAKIGNHTFRATGITTYLKNGGSLENAAAMANHASTRTTQLYDRRRDEVNLNEVERISI
jgi:site-specific recombinase XerD